MKKLLFLLWIIPLVCLGQVDQNGAPFAQKIKLTAGLSSDWVNNFYQGTTSGAVTSTFGGQLFYGLDATSGNYYRYEAIANNYWYRVVQSGALVAGSNISITGSWPNQTINSTSSGVTSITGTTNQINVTGTTTPILSLPNTLIIPGTLAEGTLSYTDTGILASLQSSTNSYNQLILQNTNSGSTASTDFVVSNDIGTATTNYGNFGMNSSGFTGTPIFNQPSYVYLTSTTRDIAIGTTTANAIHFVVNNGTADAMTISSAGIASFSTPIQSTSVATMTATVGGGVPTPPNNTTTFLRGDGTFATPAGGGDMVLASAQTNTGVKTFNDATFLMRNVANTFSSNFTNTNTASRIYTLPDAAGTVSLIGNAETLSGIKTFSAAPVLNALPTGTAVSNTATISTLASRDASNRLLAANHVDGFNTTATAAGTTTLTVSSNKIQVFTGSTTQTVVLPTTSIVAGQEYWIYNNSTGVVTVQPSGGGTLVVIGSNTLLNVKALTATPTTNAGWQSNYQPLYYDYLKSNIFLSSGAPITTMSGTSNISMGYLSMQQMTTGGNNIAIGTNAMRYNGGGSSNIAIGLGAVPLGATGVPGTGNANIGIGDNALGNVSTGSNNTAVGVAAGQSNLTTVSQNTLIGASASLGTAVSNATALGYNTFVNASNTMVFGNTSVVGWGFGVDAGAAAIKVGSTTSNGNGATLTLAGVWTNASDKTKKKNIEPMNYGLNEVLKLNAVQYDWKQGGKHDIGFIAQEVKKIIPEIVYGEEGEMTLSYGQITALLVKAIQEQQKQIEQLKSKLK